ncbi:hypothetical protein C8R46DRAFT_1213474 [Mycena filopes]|nr:hypothetical protein C8R46DRAFT_1213474 [Mycena filopes]
MATLDSQSTKKMRYGGRGGAGSRARTIVRPAPTPIVGQYTFATIPESQTTNFTANWVRQTASPPTSPRESSDTLPDTPPVADIPSSSLAGRRGAAKIPAPLIIAPASGTVPTPLSSATSSTSTSTATDSDFTPTPRSPYFYFDEAFDSRSIGAGLPLPSPTASTTTTSTSSSNSKSFSRSIRRLASRTQVLKELFLRPPSTPPTPTSPTSPSPALAALPVPPLPPLPTLTLRPPSQVSQASEWYDTPESPTSTDPAPSAPSTALLAPVSDAIVIALDLPGRRRSASVATVKDRKHTHKHRGERERERERRHHGPREQGNWNRDDLREVIVGLRML